MRESIEKGSVFSRITSVNDLTFSLELLYGCPHIRFLKGNNLH